MVTLSSDRRVGARQAGFSLLMTLLSLLILSLSAMAMMSLLKAGVSTSGNIAFRQAAVRAADLGVEAAITWIGGQGVEYLKDTHADQGYYATSDPTFDPRTTLNFATSARVLGPTGTPGSAATPVSGYSVYYVIHRMSTTVGKCADIDGCLYPPVVTASETGQGSSSSGGGGYTTGLSASTGAVYYRVTVKVAGPRYNNRYVQAFVY